jgi:hypothetical protein
VRVRRLCHQGDPGHGTGSGSAGAPTTGSCPSLALSAGFEFMPLASPRRDRSTAQLMCCVTEPGDFARTSNLGRVEVRVDENEKLVRACVWLPSALVNGEHAIGKPPAATVVSGEPSSKGRRPVAGDLLGRSAWGLRSQRDYKSC